MDKPFQTGLSQPPLYEEPVHLVPSWQKQIQLLGHLCQFSQNVLLVLGPLSLGKTSFSKIFADYKIPGLRKVLLQGKTIQSTEALMQAITSGFELPISDNPEQDVYDALVQREDKSLTWTVVVDDADYLPSETLQALLRLVDFEQPPKQQLRLILVTEPSFETTMQTPEIEALVHDRIHPIELDCWHQEDVEYLLNKQGKKISHPFVHTLLEQTKGYPRDILDRVNLVVQGENKAKQPVNTPWIKKVDKPVLYGVSLGLVFGVGYLLLNFGDDDLPLAQPVNVAQLEESVNTNTVIKPNQATHRNFNFENEAPRKTDDSRIASKKTQDTSNKTLASKDEGIRFTLKKPVSSTVKVEDKPKDASNTIANVAKAPKVLAKPKVNDSIALIAEAEKDENINTQVQAKKETQKPKVIAKVEKKPAVVAKKEDKPQQVKPVVAKAQKKVEAPKHVEKSQYVAKGKSNTETELFSLTQDEEVILARNGKNYTLQLVGSSKSPNLKSFLKENNLNQNGQLVRTTRSGKEWYVILYGSYPSYNAAKQAASGIERKSNVKPWVRSYKSIQNDIQRLARSRGNTGLVILPKERDQNNDVG